MKIRIKGNSVRIRVTKSEVARFTEEGRLEEKTEFGDSVLTYALQCSDKYENPAADFKSNLITVYIPTRVKKEWVETDQVGFNHRMDIGNDKTLFILVEKDFVCLDHTFEDQSDNFPNPNRTC
ncbi:MAG TPA: hypothetical protein PLH61_12225 [Bacteroidia bacterium]|jgi:hypothetical protein|nr:hypothetical protein [Bacteroidia bacterium]HQK98779.1 hypothetical protein [Bacteroidia bacterium]